MKKELLIVFAVVSGLVASAAERLPIDARMIRGDGERSIRGWTFNEVEGYKPYGDVLPVMLNGLAGVRLVSKGKPTTIYHATALPVKAGETVILRARARGRGRASVGCFLYGDRWAWKGSKGTPQKVVAADAEPVEIEERVDVPEGVTSVRPTLSTSGGDDVEIYDLRVEKE